MPALHDATNTLQRWLQHWTKHLMPALHDATNTPQRWRVDSASHRAADLQMSSIQRSRSFGNAGNSTSPCRSWIEIGHTMRRTINPPALEGVRSIV
jgi:hypothetical protein